MLIRLGVVLLFCFWAKVSVALTAEEIFQLNQNRLLQIKLVEIESDSKSSLGSGFVVAQETMVATNYHVVSQAVSAPDKYRIEYLREDGSTGELQLWYIDIVNDLALLTSETPIAEPLKIEASAPRKGAKIFALGNPMDLGMTVVPGTYNGLTEHSFYKRIHFSGSVNSGMSGGPVLNEAGNVVGVNVATAGNQMSFLIPADKLNPMIHTSLMVEKETLLEYAAKQLERSQSDLMKVLLENKWKLEKLGEAMVPGEVGDVVSCWGRSTRGDNKKEDTAIVEISKGCSLQDSIYISSHMTTGSIEYEFYWYEAENLADKRFTKFIEKNMGGYPGNRVGKEDATEFKCDEAFTTLPGVEDPSALVKTVYCARRYKEFSELYDVFYLRFAKRGSKALISHFTLAGVTQVSANQFAERFLESVTWQ